MSGSRERGRNCPVHPRRIGNYANSSSKLYGAFLILRLSFTSDKLGIHRGGGGGGSVRKCQVVEVSKSHSYIIQSFIYYLCHSGPERGDPSYSLSNPFHIRVTWTPQGGSNKFPISISYPHNCGGCRPPP